MEHDAGWGQVIRRTFGDRVRAARLARSISQEELALRCGLDRSYVGQVERGERNLTLENIYRIAEGLGIPPSDLMGGINSELDLHHAGGEK